MFQELSEFIEYLANKNVGTATRKKSLAIQQIRDEFGVALSTVYEMMKPENAGIYYVFVDYKNGESSILRTSAKCKFTP